MLGWCIIVFRQADGGALPATSDSQEGARVAIWQTSLGGLNWLDELVAEGHAADLGRGGYPSRYTARAEHLLQPIIDGPPGAREFWAIGVGDVIGEGWEGQTTVDRAVADECGPDEWLLVHAWDES